MVWRGVLRVKSKEDMGERLRPCSVVNSHTHDTDVLYSQNLFKNNFDISNYCAHVADKWTKRDINPNDTDIFYFNQLKTPHGPPGVRLSQFEPENISYLFHIFFRFSLKCKELSWTSSTAVNPAPL